jgi:hypothetical protein
MPALYYASAAASFASAQKVIYLLYFQNRIDQSKTKSGMCGKRSSGDFWQFV